MVEIIINWIQNKARIEDNKKDRYGGISIAGMEFVDEADLKAQIMNIYENDEINMRDNETGTKTDKYAAR